MRIHPQEHEVHAHLQPVRLKANALLAKQWATWGRRRRPASLDPAGLPRTHVQPNTLRDRGSVPGLTAPYAKTGIITSKKALTRQTLTGLLARSILALKALRCNIQQRGTDNNTPSLSPETHDKGSRIEHVRDKRSRNEPATPAVVTGRRDAPSQAGGRADPARATDSRQHESTNAKKKARGGYVRTHARGAAK